MLFLKIFIIFSNLHAAFLKHEVATPQFKEFEYAEVCEVMGAKNSILISPHSLTEIECFNKNYSLLDFCLKKFPVERTLTRGFIDRIKKKVVCEMSESVIISLSCDKRDSKFCLDPKKGCEDLKMIYANRLELAHSSLVEKKLNCYFSKIIEESLDEI
jgi:hypothetical protein